MTEPQTADVKPTDEQSPLVVVLDDIQDLIGAVGGVRRRRKELKELEMTLAHTIVCGGDIEASDVLIRDRLRLVVAMWQQMIESEVVELVCAVAGRDLERADYYGGIERIIDDLGGKE